MSQYTKSSTSGNWIMDDNIIYWRELTTLHKFDTILNTWINEAPTEKRFTPQESPFKCAKSIDTSVIIMLEKDDLDSATGKSIFFYERKINFSVRPDYENVWICKGEDNRIYCKNLLNMSTWRLDPSSSEYIKCKKISEKKIDKEIAKELNKTTNYVFNKMEEMPDGDTIFGQFVKPS